MIVPFRLQPSEEVLGYIGIDIDNSYFPFLQFRCVLIGCLLYLLSDIIFQPSKSEEEKNKLKKSNESCGDGLCFKIFMFLHNMALCLFSVLCFLNTFYYPYKLYMSNPEGGWSYVCQHGWKKAFYDESFGFWAYLFYLSKYYEFVDTWIVILRGRRPIFLQVFHHIGAVIGMWMGMVLQSTGCYIFVIANSFIHSIMYFYYACSVLKIRLPFKSIITKMQMTQFIVGNSIALWQVYSYSNVLPWADKFCILYHVIYTSVLLVLFQRFYKKTYKSKKKLQTKSQ